MNAMTALLPITEIGVFCLGGFVWLRSQTKPYPVVAALTLGIVSGLGFLSLLFQVGFLVGLPEVIPILEGSALLGIVWLNWPHWRLIDDIRRGAIAAWCKSPVVLTVLAIALTYLFLQAVLLPPSSWDALTYHLPRVLQWEQNRSLFLRGFTISPQAAFPVGSDILFHAFLRFQTDYGLGLFSWLSYVTILLGTYALARPRVTHAIALTTAIAIACLPEIVYQATGTKNDIIMAAVALACIFWSDRALTVASIESLLGLGLTLCFGVAVKTSFVLFAFFFVPLWLSLVIQQGKLYPLLGVVVKQWHVVVAGLLPGGVLSQGWLFWDNYRQFGKWSGPPEFAFKNQNNEGILGGVANLVRYSFQSIHLLHPVDALWERLWGMPLTAGLQFIYDTLFAPLFGNAGQAELWKWQALEIVWQPQEDTSWFGPVSVFLVFPAVAWCVVRGRALSRLVALVAIALVLAISYKIGWSPWKSRFFTVAYACTGLCVAMFLQQLNVRTWVLQGLRWLSLVILVYACLFNFSKPVFPSEYYLGRANIWTLSDWTRDRLVYDHLYHGNRFENLSQALVDAKQVAIVGYDHYFSLMFQHPDLAFVFLRTEDDSNGNLHLAPVQTRLVEMDHLVCFQRCDLTGVEIDLDLRWEDDSDDKAPQVYRIASQGSN